MTTAFVGESNSLFSLPLGEDNVKWTVWLEKEELWKRLRTLSHVAVLEGEKLEVSKNLCSNQLFQVKELEVVDTLVQKRQAKSWTKLPNLLGAIKPGPKGKK